MEGRSPREEFALTSPQQEEKSRAQVIKDYKLAVEYKWLKKQAPGGVYVMPSPKDIRLWHGVVFVRKAMYSNGIFKFRIELPPEYNDVGVYPRVFFVTPVFNPLVHPQTGELDLPWALPEWNPDKHFLVTVLTFLKKIFYMKDFRHHHQDHGLSASSSRQPRPPFNPEAYRLVQEDKAEFLRRVEECVAASQLNVYDPRDGSIIRFTEPKPEHELLGKAIQEANEAPAPPGAPVLEEGHKRLNVMSIIRTVVESSVTGTPLPRTLLPPPHPPQRSTATALP